MKISTKEVLSNWEYWTNEKELMKEDLFIELNGIKYELAGISRKNSTISYLDNGKIFTIPSDEVEFIEVI